MAALLVSVGSWLMAGLLARMLIGAGLTIVTAVGVWALVSSLLNSIAGLFGQLPDAVVQICLLAGFGEGLSIVGGAVVSLVAVRSLMALGVRVG